MDFNHRLQAGGDVAIIRYLGVLVDLVLSLLIDRPHLRALGLKPFRESQRRGVTGEGLVEIVAVRAKADCVIQVVAKIEVAPGQNVRPVHLCLMPSLATDSTCPLVAQLDRQSCDAVTMIFPLAGVPVRPIFRAPPLSPFDPPPLQGRLAFKFRAFHGRS